MDKMSPVGWTSVSGLMLFLILLLHTYALNYPPFILHNFLPDVVRIANEGLVIILLSVICLRYRYFSEAVWIVPVSALFGFSLILGLDTVIKLVSSYNKLIVLFLLIGVLASNRRALGACITTWIRLSYLLCIMAILAIVAYKSGILSFSPTVMGRYYYLHHDILGNLIPRYLFDIPFARVVGYMTEGQYLGFVMGFNILASRSWIDDPRSRNRFVWLNLIAGLTTLSTTFYAFFAIYLLATFSVGGKKPDVPFRLVILFTLGVFLVYFLVDHMAYSHAERIRSVFLVLDVLRQSDWITLLFGHGVRAVLTTESGWLSILVDRGVLMMVFMLFLMIRYTRHNRWLLFYVLVTQLANTQFWYPVFILLVAMTYAASRTSRFDRFVWQTGEPVGTGVTCAEGSSISKKSGELQPI